MLFMRAFLLVGAMPGIARLEGAGAIRQDQDQIAELKGAAVITHDMITSDQ